ncbi:hypothetical protein JFT85_22935 [Pseudomonas sp. TH04]|uniref:hypothetical protein n=1 Tax=Pseudomonas sp. TH04 TaxID=2796370 RepID=UPI00191263D6|nr:hypothetical protein [Pseudomonas sp. TH04]MBK5547619.1 hypothetical protein [Pseudomonas sp. TH04]
MIKLPRWATIDNGVQKKLDAIKVDLRPKRWYGKAKAVVEFKSQVLTQGRVIQRKRCAWCTLPLGEEGRRTIHRDHIAPSSIYPQWTFVAKNLVISCEYCNGLAVKADIDTIKVLRDKYDDCEFHIVHPYDDEIECHIQFDDDEDQLPVVVRGISPKGLWTIENMKLNDVGLTRERAKEVYYERRGLTLPAPEEDLIERALGAMSVAQ